MTLDDRRPTTTDYDRASRSFDSEEAIRITGEEVTGETTLGILVSAYTGAGEYELRIEERR